MFNKLLGALLFAACVSGTTSAFALSDSEIEDSIRETLAQLHPRDTDAYWKGLGPRAPEIMIGIYQKSDRVYYHVRLLQALRYFPDDQKAIDFLKEQAQSAPDSIARKSAVESVAASQGAKEADFVAKSLSNPDPDFRAAAAGALKKMNDPHANELVDKFLSEEKTPWVVAKVKGEKLEKPTGTLPIAASSDDRPDSAWVGKWEGYFIHPKEGKLAQEAASMEVSDAGESGGLRAQITVGGKKTTVTWKSSRDQESGNFAEGFLKGQKYAARALHEKGSLIVDVRVPGIAGYFVLIKR